MPTASSMRPPRGGLGPPRSKVSGPWALQSRLALILGESNETLLVFVQLTTKKPKKCLFRPGVFVALLLGLAPTPTPMSMSMTWVAHIPVPSS
jgi:hypothetical protein